MACISPNLLFFIAHYYTEFLLLLRSEPKLLRVSYERLERSKWFLTMVTDVQVSIDTGESSRASWRKQTLKSFQVRELLLWYLFKMYF